MHTTVKIAGAMCRTRNTNVVVTLKYRIAGRIRTSLVPRMGAEGDVHSKVGCWTGAKE